MNKKRILSIILVTVIVLTALPIGNIIFADENTDFTGYTAISTKEQLNDIRNDLTGKYYLTNDIVFTDADFASGGEFCNNGNYWTPIGNIVNKFTGIFFVKKTVA